MTGPAIRPGASPDGSRQEPIAAGFRHKIGDALYDLYTPYDAGDQETVRYPIVARTERYVYVEERIGRHRRIRFSVADLERDGHDFNRANLMMLHVRPRADWPLMDAEVRKPEQSALTAARRTAP